MGLVQGVRGGLEGEEGSRGRAGSEDRSKEGNWCKMGMGKEGTRSKVRGDEKGWEGWR